MATCCSKFRQAWQKRSAGTHMSTHSSVMPWKELAGMISILMLSAISLHRRDKSDAEPLDSLVGLKLVNVCESKKKKKRAV